MGGVAVLRDDLHTFIISADVPGAGRGVPVSMLRMDLLSHLMRLPLADWSCPEKLVFGETSWLTHREDVAWRKIRRINISDERMVSPGEDLPPFVAEPILRMLEGSVKAPDLVGQWIKEDGCDEQF